MQAFRDWLVEQGWSPALATSAAVLLALLGAYLIGRLARRLAEGPLARRLEHAEAWQEAMSRRPVLSRAGLAASVLVARLVVPGLFEPWPRVEAALGTILDVGLVLAVTLTLSGLVAAGAEAVQRRRQSEQRLPYKVLAQGAQVVIWAYAGVVLLSVLTGKDVGTVLTALTAVGAVLVYVFRDPLLGWTASVQLAGNDLVREGDWISVPKHDADGRVEEIALTTVRIRNWDNTVSAVPTYALFSEGFQNWRGMFESGGRRIKRSFAIDTTTIRFCDPDLRHRIHASPYVAPFLDPAPPEGEGPEDGSASPPTNLGLFRAWLHAWLERHPDVHEGMMRMVRELNPDGRGLPLEIYVFSRDTSWPAYERLQADILDHALAVLPVFELRPFQENTGFEPLSRAGRAD